MNYLIYDLEIVKAIPGKEPRIPGIDYCEGWHDHENMGISVLCAYESWSNRYRVFMADNNKEFAASVETADLIVGFNSLAFDNEVVIETWGLNLHAKANYDLLVEIWMASGLEPRFKYPSHIGYGLDATLAANGMGGKTGHGANAPIQWQRGEIGAVVDYCMEDVRLTKMLFDHVLALQQIQSPKGGYIDLRHPDYLVKLAQG